MEQSCSQADNSSSGDRITGYFIDFLSAHFPQDHGPCLLDSSLQNFFELQLRESENLGILILTFYKVRVGHSHRTPDDPLGVGNSLLKGFLNEGRRPRRLETEPKQWNCEPNSQERP